MNDLALCGPVHGRLEPTLEVMAIGLVQPIRDLSDDSRDYLFYWVSGYADAQAATELAKHFEKRISAQDFRSRLTLICNGFQLPVDWASRQGKMVIDRAYSLADDDKFAVPGQAIIKDTPAIAQPAANDPDAGERPAQGSAIATGQEAPPAPAAPPIKSTDLIVRIAGQLAKTRRLPKLNGRSFRVLAGLERGLDNAQIAREEGTGTGPISTTLTKLYSRFGISPAPGRERCGLAERALLGQAFTYFRRGLDQAGAEELASIVPNLKPLDPIVVVPDVERAPAAEAPGPGASPASVPAAPAVHKAAKSLLTHTLSIDLPDRATVRGSVLVKSTLKNHDKRVAELEKLGYVHEADLKITIVGTTTVYEVWVKRRTPEQRT